MKAKDIVISIDDELKLRIEWKMLNEDTLGHATPGAGGCC